MSTSADLDPLELHLFAPERSDQLVELLTAIAHYHRIESSLNLGDTVNFGRGWIGDSECNHGLVSLPYLDGPKLEWLVAGEFSVRFLWLVPITEKEVQYKKEFGLESLEARLEAAAFNYLDSNRDSVV